SGLSSSLIRMPRMAHLVNNVRVQETTAESLKVHAKFQANAYKLDEHRVDFFFGDYHYDLVRKGGGFSIKTKKVIIRNDIIPRQLDFFSV
ncbi:MAG: aromatic-ring-hydroxylating dioxygenase subunit beta, partial [Gammaproteobacteria bacterium]